MARTIRTKVYKFAELSKEAKKKALNEYEPFTDHIFQEASDTLQKFAEIFNVKIRHFDFLETYRNDFRFDQDETILDLAGFRLKKYIWNNYRSDIFKGKYYGKLVSTNKDGSPVIVSKEYPNGTRHVRRYSKCVLTHSCVLTGVCYDESILEPIYVFLDNLDDNTTFEGLISDCVSNLCKDVQNEYEANFEDINKQESIEANEYEFLQDGTRY